MFKNQLNNCMISQCFDVLHNLELLVANTQQKPTVLKRYFPSIVLYNLTFLVAKIKKCSEENYSLSSWQLNDTLLSNEIADCLEQRVNIRLQSKGMSVIFKVTFERYILLGN